MPNTPTTLLTISQAAKMLGVSADTLRNWDDSGKLKSVRTDGNQRRYYLSEITAFQNVPLKYQRQNSAEVAAQPSSPIASFSNSSPNSGLFQPREITPVSQATPTPDASARYPINELPSSYLPAELSRPSLAFSPKQAVLIKALIITLIVCASIFTFDRFGITKDITQLLSGKTSTVETSQLFSLPGEIDSSVLAAATGGPNLTLAFNIPIKYMKPASFQDNVSIAQNASISGSATISGPTTLNSDLQVDQNTNIDGNLTVKGNLITPNIITRLLSGTGIRVTTGSTPTVTNTDPGSAQKFFKTFKVDSQTDVTAGINGDALTLAAGSGISLTTGDKKITITNSSQGSSTPSVSNGGTGQTSYAVGDMLYASGTTELSKLAIGSTNQILSVSGGIPAWVSPGSVLACSDCLLTDPSSTQTITPTSASATGLSVAQASSGTADVFNVTDNAGTTKFLKVDSSGYVSVGTYLASDLTPYTGSAFDIGSSSRRWRTIYADTGNFTNLVTTNVTISGTTSEDFLINSDYTGPDSQSSTLSFERGAPGVNAQLKWRALDSPLPNELFSLNAPLLIEQDAGINYSGTSALILNQVQSQDIFTASASGVTRFTIGNSGDVSIPTLSSGPIYSNSGTLTSEAQLAISRGGTNTNTTPTAGSITYGTGTAYGFSTVGTAGQLLVSGGAGTPTWIDPSSVGVSLWVLNSGSLSPTTSTNSVSIGGLTTTPHVLGVSGAATGKSLVNFNETGDQNILTASASGTNVFTLSRTGTLSLNNSTGFIDLSNVGYSSTAPQGLRLPQNSSLSNPSTGEGYLGYDTTSKEVKVFNGTIWASINGASTSLQQAYANSGEPEIVLDGTHHALSLRDNSTPLGTSLFEVQNNAGSTSYLSVSASGVSLSSLSSGVVYDNSGTLTSEAQLAISRGGTNTNTTPTAGAVSYGTGTAFAFTAAGNAGQLLASGGAGTPTWVDPNTVGVNLWQLNSGSLAPNTLSNSLSLGGSTTTVHTLGVSGAALGKSLVNLNETGDQNILTASASGVNKFILDRSGNITAGTYNGQTISANANFTGSVTVANNFTLSAGNLLTPISSGVVFSNSGTLTSEAQLAIARGGTNTNTTPTAGSITYGTGTAYGFSTVGTAGQLLVSGGTGTPTWIDPSAVGVSLWVLNSGSLSPTTSTNSVSIGGLTTTPHVLGVSGAATGKSLVNFNETGDQNILTASASGVNKFILDRSGNITAGTYNGQTISATANFTGSATFATGVTVTNLSSGAVYSNSGSLSSEAQLAISRGGTNTNTTPTAGAVSYGTGTAFAFTAAGNTGQLLASGGSGTPTWVDPNTVGVNLWQLNSGSLAPNTLTNSLSLGGSTTTVHLLGISGASSGKALVSLNETGDQAILTASASGVTKFTINRTGTVTINDLSSGAIYSNSGTLTSEAQLAISRGGTNTNTTPTAGAVSYGTGTAFAFTAAGNTGQLLASGGSGTPTWVDPNTVGVSLWQLNSGSLAPNTLTNNLSLGGSTTTVHLLGISGSAVGKSLINLNETGDQNILTASASGVNKFILDRSGNITAGTYNGQTISATANFTGSATFATGVTVTNLTSGAVYSNSGALTSEAQLAISRGGTNTNTTPTAGAIAYGTGTAYAFTTAGSSGQVLLSTGVGTPIWANPGSVGTNYWQHNSTSISPLTSTDSLALGGGTTTSHIFGVSGAATGKALVALNETGDQDILTASASGVNKFTIDRTGTITTGIWNGSTIGYQYGGTNTNTTPTQGGITYGTGSAYAFSSAGTSGQLFMSNGTSAPSWTSPSSVGTNFWQDNSNVLAPGNSATVTDKLVLGGSTTTNHQFEVNGKITGKALVNLNETGDQNILTASASGVNKFILDRSGNITAGTYNGQTISATANFTGSATFATGVTVTNLTSGVVYSNSGALTSEAQLAISRGGTNTNTTPTQGGITYGTGSAYAFSAAGSSGQLLMSNATSAPTWVNNPGNYWQLNSGSLAPATTTNNFVLGGATTTNHIMEVNGKATGRALIALNETGDQAILTASASGVTKFTVNRTGTVTINDLASGALYSNSGTLTSEAQLAIARGGTNTNTTPAAGAVTYGTGTAYGFTSVGTAGQLLVSGGTGTPTWVDASTAGVNYWNISSTSLVPTNTAYHLAIGTAPTPHYFGVSGAVTGAALVNLNETGDQNILTASASGVNKFILDRSGNITAGTYNGQTISATANFTGSATFATGVTVTNLTSGVVYSNSGALTSEAQLAISRGGTNTNTTPTQGGITYGTGSAYAFSAAGSSGQLLMSNATSAPTWINNPGNYWQLNSGSLAPVTTTNNLVLGGSTTTSYLFEANGKITGKALVNLNETGDQNILTASASGVNKFILDRSGNVTAAGNLTSTSGTIQTGTTDRITNAGALTNITGYTQSSGNFGISGTGTFGTGTGAISLNGDSTIAANKSLYLAVGTGKAGIGNVSPDGKLQVDGAATGKSLVVINETGDQNLLTASASGVTKFTVDRSGNITAGTINTATISGGSLTGGTYTATGLSVAGNYTATIGNTSSFSISDGSNTLMTVADNGTYGRLGIGATPTSILHVSGAATGKALAVLNETGDQDILSGSASGTNVFRLDRTGKIYGTAGDFTNSTFSSGNLLNVNASGTSAWSSGYLLNVSSVSTGLTTGRLASFDWSPGSAATAATDLFRINIGPNGNVDNLLNITDNGTSVFSVGETSITSAVPHSFTAAGDVTVAYDLLFTNQSSSYIKSDAPLYIQTGETFESNNLTLKTYNSGNIIMDIASGGVSIGSAVSPTSKFEVNTAKTGKSLVTFNETGDQAILTASASGTTRFTINNAGNTFTTLRNTGTYAICHATNGAGYDELTDCLTSVNADYMEMYPVDTSANLGTIVAPGQLITYTTHGDSIPVLVPTTSDYQSNVIGIVSDKSQASDFNSIGYNISSADNPQPIALSGRVQVKVSPDSGAISAGQFLTTSGSHPGMATKATRPGTMVAKALQNWDPSHPTSTILAYVTNTWADPTFVFNFDNSGNLTLNGSVTAQEVSVAPAATPNSPVPTPTTSLSSLESEISSLNTTIASVSARLANLEVSAPPAAADQYLISDSWLLNASSSGQDLLTTIHPVQVPELTVAGKLSVGLVTIDDLAASISSLTGKLTINGDLAVSGTLTAASVSAQTVIADTVSTQHLQVLGSATLGTNTLPAGLTEVVVNAPAVSSESAVFITPTSLSTYPLSVTETTPGFSFKVASPNPQDHDVPFKWWIVN